MKIKIKKGGCFIIAFEQYFQTIDSLKDFIKGKNEFINIESLHDRICNVYQQLKDSDEEIKSSILDWRIVQEFNFKNKSAFKLDFWIERGYSIKEFNDWVCKRRNIEPIKSLLFCNKNKFKYGKYKYEQHGEPTCNLCKSKINFDILVDTYIIKECKNLGCASHFNKEIESIRQLAFLPNKLFISKNKKLNLESRVYKEYWLLNEFSYENSLTEISKLKQQLIGIHQNTAIYYEATLELTKKEADLRMKKQSHWSIEHYANESLLEDEIKANIQNLQRVNGIKFSNKRKIDPGAFSAITETQIGYWLNKGLSIDEANVALSKRQSTFSKEICIEKYGEEVGLEKFTERQNKWNKSLNEGGNLKVGYSKCSQDLFYSLLEKYEIKDRDGIFFATKNNEYKISRKEGGIWMYDFTDIKKKKIIEYNGDMYHGNPKKYSSDDFPHPFRKKITAQEMWDKDELKKRRAKENGFDVLVVWDSEYRWGNKQEVINKCLSFLNVI